MPLPWQTPWVVGWVVGWVVFKKFRYSEDPDFLLISVMKILPNFFGKPLVWAQVTEPAPVTSPPQESSPLPVSEKDRYPEV